MKITSITGLPPRLASNKANSIKTDTPAKVTAEVCLVSCLTSFRKGVCSQSSHEISLPVCRIYTPPKKDGVETIQEKVRVSKLVAMSKGYCQNTEIIGVPSVKANLRSKAMKI